MELKEKPILEFVDQLFPFHIVFNEGLIMASTGTTLKKYSAILPVRLFWITSKSLGLTITRGIEINS